MKKLFLTLALILGLSVPAFATGTVTNSIGTASRDYSTMQSWEDALPPNLITDGNSYVGQAYNDAEFDDGNVIIAGEITDATHTVTLTTGPGQSFRDNANAKTNPLFYDQTKGVGLLNTTLNVQIANIFISNLQINNVSHKKCIDGVSLSHITIDDIICLGANGGGGLVFLQGSTSIIRNSLLAVNFNGAYSIIDMFSAAKAYNTTMLALSSVGSIPSTAISSFSGVATCENCAIFNASSYQDSTVPTYTTGYSNIASPPSGVTLTTFDTANFVSTTADFRIISTSAMKDTGTTDTTNAATDIVGTSRPQFVAYDVGAFEFPLLTNIKSINGLAQASIKSVNGLAIASMKSFNGLQ